MRVASAVLVVVLSTLAFASAMPGGVGGAARTGELVYHDPIIIDGPEDLTPENGIVGGSGAPDDPYIIEGWRIFASGGNPYMPNAGIVICNVSGYFLIRNLVIYGSWPADPWNAGVGIWVRAYEAHVIVENVTFRNLGIGSHLVAASVEVRNSTFIGTISGVRAVAMSEGGYVNVTGNKFIDVHYAVRISHYKKLRNDVWVTDNIMYLPPGSLNGIMEYGVKISEFHGHGGMVYGGNLNAYIKNNTILCYSLYGIWVRSILSSNITIEGNDLGWNATCAPKRMFDMSGIKVEDSDNVNVSIEGNTIKDTFVYGVYVYNVTNANVTIRENMVYNISVCREEMFRDRGAVGVLVDSSYGVVLEGNNVSLSEEYGIRAIGSSQLVVKSNIVERAAKAGLELYSTDAALVESNVIAGNGVGLSLNQPSNVSVVYNSFLGNGIQAQINPGGMASWDDGSRGNYWSDYQGADEDGDHIGDQPYVIDRLNRDNHPLLPQASVTRVETHSSRGLTEVTVYAHITQPPGTWTITVSAASGEEASATVTVASVPRDVTVKLSLPASEHYTVTLTAPHGETAATEEASPAQPGASETPGGQETGQQGHTTSPGTTGTPQNTTEGAARQTPSQASSTGPQATQTHAGEAGGGGVPGKALAAALTALAALAAALLLLRLRG